MNQLNNNAILCNGKYRLEKILGQGGFGITYKAIMKETVSGSLGNMEIDVPVAIKEFFMKDTCEREEGTGKITVPSLGSRALVELYRKKFVKEAKNLAQMNHPHIVKVVDVFEENDTVYYVMQYLSGGSLSDYVKLHGALDEAIAINYIQQIGSALEYMHQKHICHYDVKPSNILLDDKGGAMLIDFGISKGYTEEGHQTSSTPVGISAGYAPLEQYQQSLQDFSPATDVYGLAATLFYLLTGKNPPEASIVLNEGIEDKPISISDRVWHAIEQGMNPRKKDRVQTVSDFLKLMNCMMPTPASEVLANQEKTQVLSQKLSGNLLDTHEQTIVAPKNEENVEYIDEDDNTSNSRRIFLAILAVLIIGCVYAFMKCQGNNEAKEKAEPKKTELTINKEQELNEESAKEDEQNINTSIEKKDKKQCVEHDVNDELQNYNINQESQARVYDVVDEMPCYPGGSNALMRYLASNVKYPAEAQKNGIQGRVVVGFVVDVDGGISNVEVVRPVDPSLNKEALRVVKSMPRWIPGRQNGECVRVRYNVPIAFRLE